MKRIRTHYDNLKVARDAPPEVIIAAYKSLSMKYHPDRNPNNPNATRIMKIINASYEVLSDPIKRSHHDEWIKSQEIDEYAHSEFADKSTDTHTEVKIDTPVAGVCSFIDLSARAKEKLIERTNGKNQQQYAVKTNDASWKYFWLAACVVWFIYLLYNSSAFRWEEKSTQWRFVLTTLAGLILSVTINWLFEWRKSPIHCWLIISPLYVIKTHLDKVWYWPIWLISDIKATHNYTNSGYDNTTLEISFEGKTESFKIWPASAYNSILATLKTFEDQFRAAVNKGDLDYVLRNDDFTGCKKKSIGTQSRRQSIRRVLVIIASFLISAIFFSTAYIINIQQPYKPVKTKSSTAVNIPYTHIQPLSKPSYIRPSTAPNGEPWPSSAAYVAGYKRLHTNGLSTVTIDNSKNGSDVFVKLVFIGDQKAYPIRVLFIPAYNRYNINKVRAGLYDIRYRDLESGALTRSESFLLQEIETAEGIEYKDLTMTLYKVRDGNMQTYSISEDEF